MKSITITGSKRESVGKLSTKALRNAEMVPCVLYGGDGPIHFSAKEISFSKLVYTPQVYTVVIELDGGVKKNAILQDIQFHPVSDKILHIDFFELHDDKPVIMNIPVHLQGSSIGVLRGGSLRHNMRTLRVKALPKNLPDFLTAEITDLKIGNKLYVTELVNDAYTIMHPDNTVVVQVRMARNASDDEEETEEGGEEGEEEAKEGEEKTAATE